VPASFKTNPISLDELLRACETGEIQLPDFQRSWVWDDDRIRSLIASISQAFPVGALMTLETGGEVDFKPRLIQGAPDSHAGAHPRSLLLDGQQRMTSLYQTARRRQVVETITARRVKVKRWYYIDIEAALDPAKVREEAIIGVPEDRVVRENFGKDVLLDLSTPQKEYQALMFPVNQVFDWDDWQDGFRDFWEDDKEKRDLFRAFKAEILQNFKSYDVPVISLDRNTSKEAVCLVFEKVNTGGKALDAFELVTAMYAADGFELRKDWFARQQRLSQWKALSQVANTEFLQAISLLHTKEARLAADAAGDKGRELPVSATRQSLLKLPLAAYEKFADKVEEGFVRAAKFLHGQNIFRAYDLPYQSQLTPLAAILADLGAQWEHDEVRRKLALWFWNGVFGELYGSAVESRFARDIVEVPSWIARGHVPSTVSQATFRADRLLSMRSRVSAAYKGLNALLMEAGAHDFRSGQKFDQAVFFEENVDIHHIFPRDWCEKQGIKAAIYDSIINKTPLGARTNRILGGVAPTAYIQRLETGWKDHPAIDPARLDEHLRSHLIDPALLRSDAFDDFMKARRRSLEELIEVAIGKPIYRGDGADEAEEDLADDHDLTEEAA
jgi:hypothetical protein